MKQTNDQFQLVLLLSRAPYPNDSDVYNAIRDRVRKEIFKGEEAKGKHRTGSEAAALTIIGSAAAAYVLYATHCNALTGGLLGESTHIRGLKFKTRLQMTPLCCDFQQATVMCSSVKERLLNIFLPSGPLD